MPRRFKLICALKEREEWVLSDSGVWKAPNYLQVFQFYFAYTDVLGYMLEVSTPYGVQVFKIGKSVPRARGWGSDLGTRAPAVLTNWDSGPLSSLGCCHWFSLVTGSSLFCFAKFLLYNVFGTDTSLFLNLNVPCSGLSQPVAATGANRHWPHASGILEQLVWSEHQSYPSVTAQE